MEAAVINSCQRLCEGQGGQKETADHRAVFHTPVRVYGGIPPAPGHAQSQEGLHQGQPAFPGLHSPFRWAGYPPALGPALEGGVSHFTAQGQQRGPHGHLAGGPRAGALLRNPPAPPSARLSLPDTKHSATGLGHLWKGRGQGVGLATADRCRPESIPDSCR